ncbi:MAG: hypothetical protein A2Y33_01345 [Spirochaetes bacterium GWF1_51_8]|nr:MAG: hypothetical protein A2Y33_01345 [Spirochaetes bacterium GWF1_51_8]
MGKPELHPSVSGLIRRLEGIVEVEGILLGGSVAEGTADPESDYDLYVYSNFAVPLEKRREQIFDLFGTIEMNNRFWETEDDGILSNGNIQAEIVYRDIEWLKDVIESRIFRFQADTGYTTCFWANFIHSEILFDRNKILAGLKERYTITYPPELKKNIIRKNFAILKKGIPAYYHQIAKAAGRNDTVSVNHRVAAFLASYFDILFALNEIPHPGEKKIVRILNERAKLLPENFQKDVSCLIGQSGSCSLEISSTLDRIHSRLESLLISEGFSQKTF